jgi:hypothetical protein
MQTFLPHSDFELSARALDDKRLQKQLVECYQILLVLTELNPDGDHRDPGGWRNHPAVAMWRGYEHTLIAYTDAITAELQRRPKRDGSPRSIKTWGKVVNTYLRAKDLGRIRDIDLTPGWLGDERLHRSHQLGLFRKAPHLYQHYSTAVELWDSEWPTIGPNTYFYWWPDRGWGKESSVLTV